MADSKPAPRAVEYQSQSERISNRHQIVSLLTRVKEAHSTVSIEVHGATKTYNSMLLAVEETPNYILLDELMPNDGHALATQVRKLHVHLRYQGVDVSFPTDIEVVQDKKGAAFYRAPIPNVVHYLQRRNAFRVHIDADHAISVVLPQAEQSDLCGQLRDLSFGGLGAEIESLAPLERGQIIPDCSLEVEKGDRIESELEIRFVQADPRNRSVRLGGKFLHLGRAEEAQLQRLVTRLERAMIRKRSR